MQVFLACTSLNVVGNIAEILPYYSKKSNSLTFAHEKSQRKERRKNCKKMKTIHRSERFTGCSFTEYLFCFKKTEIKSL